MFKRSKEVETHTIASLLTITAAVATTTSYIDVSDVQGLGNPLSPTTISTTASATSVASTY
ncbi:hypothetical protein N431DRAFT_424980 [Stipitochalara longipes BDJ]|nr:hypothetical protein N431DRAFT_424980 [Stipitochalara longipes BDJ]